jgi:hypothetical protein
MRSQSDFWLDLHRLADDLDKEGDGVETQVVNLVAMLDGITPTTCGVYLENLERVTAALNALSVKCKER